jgi:hypothetical protein
MPVLKMPVVKMPVLVGQYVVVGHPDRAKRTAERVARSAAGFLRSPARFGLSELTARMSTRRSA